MIFVLHFHISSVLPHEITSTSAIKAYPVALGPGEIASRTAHEWLPSILWPGQADPGPNVHQELQPEEIARLANRLAGALAAGMEAPAWTNQGLLRIAKMLLQGKTVAIQSAGRAIQVRAEAPSSWTGIRQEGSGLQSAQAGQVMIRQERSAPRRRAMAPASWRGINREARVDNGQPGGVVLSSRAPSSWLGIRRSHPSLAVAAGRFQFRR